MGNKGAVVGGTGYLQTKRNKRVKSPISIERGGDLTISEKDYFREGLMGKTFSMGLFKYGLLGTWEKGPRPDLCFKTSQ